MSSFTYNHAYKIILRINSNTFLRPSTLANVTWVIVMVSSKTFIFDFGYDAIFSLYRLVKDCSNTHLLLLKDINEIHLQYSDSHNRFSPKIRLIDISNCALIAS